MKLNLRIVFKSGHVEDVNCKDPAGFIKSFADSKTYPRTVRDENGLMALVVEEIAGLFFLNYSPGDHPE